MAEAINAGLRAGIRSGLPDLLATLRRVTDALPRRRRIVITTTLDGVVLSRVVIDPGAAS